LSATFYDLGDKVLAVCPKAGSQSIRKTLLTDLGVKEMQMHSIRNTPAKQMKAVIWFVRHPIDRARSAWRYFQNTVGWPKETGITSETYEGFVDGILDKTYDNRHWNPQVPMVTYTRFFLPTEIYRFERINDLWPEVVGKGTLKHLNQSEPTETTAYRLPELEMRYADDLYRWGRADG
jgi:hypothetical protein